MGTPTVEAELEWLDHQMGIIADELVKDKVKRLWNCARRDIQGARLDHIGIEFQFGKTHFIPPLIIEMVTGQGVWHLAQARNAIEARKCVFVEDKSMERCFERLNIFTHFDFLEKVAVYCEQQETTEFTWDEETEKELLAL